MHALQTYPENARCFTPIIDPVFSSDQNPHYYVRYRCGTASLSPKGKNQFIYLTNRYLLHKQLTNLFSCELVRRNDHKAVALLYLTCEPSGIWSSVSPAPFSEIQFYETYTDAEVEFLLKCVENFVKIQHGGEIIIKSAPCNYPIFEREKLNLVYRRVGFSVRLY